MKKNLSLPLGMLIAGLSLGLIFQNCSKVGFASGNSTSTSSGAASGSGSPTGGSGGGNFGGNDGSVGQETPAGNDDTGTALKTLRPVFAVRAMNCIACHGAIGSNIATDLGYGSPNFMPNNPFFPINSSAKRTAFNDTDDGAGIGGWQSLVVSNGSVHVPNVTVSASTASVMFGVNQNITLADVLLMNTVPKSNGRSMVAGVTPPAGQPPIIVDTAISIHYPSEAEILSLMTSAQQSSKVAVGVTQGKGSPTSQFSGLGADASGNFIRNTASTVTCNGDVAIKGALFLKNLNLATDGNGCRLYVTGTVFIQGPITYVNGGSSNLQITSARGIIMGMSLYRMAGVTGGGQLRGNGSTDLSYDTVGGPWGRFTTDLDVQYNPSGYPINGVNSSTFFDNLVLDAQLLGSELLDAADSTFVANVTSPEYTVSEPSNADNSNCGGTRVAIDYSGLLLNAPHIHSRYGGIFKGVIVSDVAMLARNTAGVQLEQFIYDPIFDSIPEGSILPALSTQILSIQH